MPVPTLVSPPLPDITPEKVVLVLSEPILKESLVVSRKTLPLPDKEPMVSAALLDKENEAPASTVKPDTSFKDPFPTNLKVPALTDVVPSKVLAPLSLRIPEPSFCSVPEELVSAVANVTVVLPVSILYC
jgi:hypothetical protein